MSTGSRLAAALRDRLRRYDWLGGKSTSVFAAAAVAATVASVAWTLSPTSTPAVPRESPEAEDSSQTSPESNQADNIPQEGTTKNDAATTLTNQISQGLFSSLWQPASQSSNCEDIQLAQGSHFSRLRRRRGTIEEMVKTSSKASLKSLYDVRWRKPLGEGTFGAVYRGTDRKTGERVAVKKISKRFTDNTTFQREIEALMHLKNAGGHPNICGLRETFDEGKHYYLVLDLVSGGEMFDHLVSQGPYSEADAARLVREVASALAWLHGIGIVHGDLKPENLMLSTESASDAVIKLVDFGCAQVTVEGSVELPASSITNTPAYTSPEILDPKRRKARIEPSFDMWALGVIIYIMLTGVHPFDLYGNATDEEIIQTILSGQRPPIRDSPLTAHLSPDALDLIDGLIQWDESKRLTAHQMLSHPWVRGETARTSVIADSDKRLSAYRAFRTSLGAKVFADMVAWSDAMDTNEVAKRTSLIERAFHSLDPEHRGYVTANELRNLRKDTNQSNEGSEDEDVESLSLSLSGFADLLAENMKNKYFPKGHLVYHEGETGNSMYFVNSGMIEIATQDGLHTKLKSGDFFGEGALLHPKRLRLESARCVTPVHAIEISREYFEKYLASDVGTQLNLREKHKSRKRQRAKTLLKLQKNMQPRDLKKRDFIFRVGEQGDAIYLVEEGRVDILINGQTVFTATSGDLVGEHSLTFGRPRNVDCVCMSDKCRVHALRAEDFFLLLDSHPSFKENIREICLRREFQKAVCAKTKRPFPQELSELKEAFDVVDIDNSGALELDNVRKIIQQFDSTYTETDVQDILASLDLDESGQISWLEFKKLFNLSDSPSKR